MNTRLIMIDTLENRQLVDGSIDIVYDINEANVAYVTLTKIDLSSYANIKYVLCPCTNTDHVTLNSDQCIYFLNDPKWLGAQIMSTVEWTIWAIINLFKDNHLNNPGELFDKTVGIIGMGRIGRNVSRILTAFGCEIIFYDPCVSGYNNTSIENIMKSSDIVSVHCTSNESTFKLISEEQFNYIRNKMYFINCSRGAVVSGKYLWNAYKSGKVKGFAIDCIDTYDPETIANIRHESLISNKVIFTDHKAGSCIESRIKTDNYVITKYLRGINYGKDENNCGVL